MRFEASSQILGIVFQGVTAVSALSGVMAYSGYGPWVPYILSSGIPITFIFAFAYADSGLFNRKNRERADFGDNYSGPTMLMDARLEARQLAMLGYVIQNGEQQSFNELADDMEDLTLREWVEMRDGVDVRELEEQYGLH